MEPEGGQEPQAQGLVYANWLRVGTTPFEMAIDFGYRADPAPPAEYPVRIVMSWEQARELRLLVDDAIETYKSDFGEIREFEGSIEPARRVGQLDPATESVEEA